MVPSSAKWCKVVGKVCCLVLVLAATWAQAQGVSVAPSRILLDGNAKSATIFLSNRSNEAETYRISLAYFLMEENGTLVRADSLATAIANFGGEVLRYSPRRVVIPAGGSQTVRLLVRRPRDRNVDDQEFRAHLSVTSVPTVPRLQEVEDQYPEVEGERQFMARPVASVETLVPIVVRFGHPEAQLTVSNGGVIEDGPGGQPAVRFSLNRTGDRSLYGNLVVTHIDPMGNESRIYYGRGIAVYTPNPRRIFTLTPTLADLNLTSGRILVDYQETPDGGGDLSTLVEINPSQLSKR